MHGRPDVERVAEAAVDAQGVPPSKGSFGEDSFVVIEKWATLADLQAHAASPHMQAYGALTKDWLARRGDRWRAPGGHTPAGAG